MFQSAEVVVTRTYAFFGEGFRWEELLALRNKVLYRNLSNVRTQITIRVFFALNQAYLVKVFDVHKLA